MNAGVLQLSGSYFKPMKQMHVHFQKSLIERETLCPYHHGSAYYGQGASELEHFIFYVNPGDFIIFCSHIAQVPNMPVYNRLQASVKGGGNKNRFEQKQDKLVNV